MIMVFWDAMACIYIYIFVVYLRILPVSQNLPGGMRKIIKKKKQQSEYPVAA
jgi:hypothetical protein